MLKSYVKIALRNLLRDKGYAAINSTGLTAGIACCLLVAAFVKFEVSHDRAHEYADRTYRIVTTAGLGDRDVPVKAPAPLGPALVRDYPGVVKQARVRCSDQPVAVTLNGHNFEEDGLCFADATLFDVLDFDLLSGNVNGALSEPWSLVISQEMARKYFGNEDPIGRQLNINGEQIYEVTGVLATSSVPSHLEFSLVGSFTTLDTIDPSIETWSDGGANPYVVLAPNFRPEQLEAFLAENLAKYMGYFGGEIQAHVQHLPDIYFSDWPPNVAERRGEKRYVYLFTAIAFLVLLVACLNYMNLSTARALRRTREVGVRKAIGATRRQLIGQFLSESVALTLTAFVGAVICAWYLLPMFGSVIDRNLDPSDLFSVPTLLYAAGAAIFVGILAGSYPAFFLSGFDPVSVLKGEQRAGRGAVWFRRVLVLTQFAACIGLAGSSVVVWRQLDFVRTTQLGFDKNNVLILAPTEQIRAQYAAFKRELLQIPNVVGISTAPMPGHTHVPLTSHRVEGYDHSSEGIPWIHTFDVDSDFRDVLDIELVAGRDFDPSLSTDIGGALLVNESAVRFFGWGLDPGDAIGKVVYRPTGSASEFRWMPARVVGVVNNFQSWTMRETLKPVFLYLLDGDIGPFGNVLVRLRPQSDEHTMSDIQAVWSDFSPNMPFGYTLLDQEVDQFYRNDIRQGKFISIFASVSILLACIGLFGLASFMTSRRKKEIGIRKLLGASVSSIVGLLCKEYVILVAFSFVVAVPITFVLVTKWLNQFAYSTALGWTLIVPLGVASLVGALAAVSYQSVKAALANPVDALRCD